MLPTAGESTAWPAGVPIKLASSPPTSRKPTLTEGRPADRTDADSAADGVQAEQQRDERMYS